MVSLPKDDCGDHYKLAVQSIIVMAFRLDMSKTVLFQVF